MHGPLAASDTAPQPVPSERATRVAVISRQALLGRLIRLALEAHDGIHVVLDVERLDDNIDNLLALRPDIVVLCADKAPVPTDLIRWLTERLNPPKVIVLRNAPTNQMIAQALEAGASACVSLQLPLRSVVEAIAGVHVPPQQTRRPAVARAPRPANGVDVLRFLTQREREVLIKFTDGASTRAIAHDLGVSLTTVRTHTQNILTKLGVHSKLEAAAYAIRNELH